MNQVLYYLELLIRDLELPEGTKFGHKIGTDSARGSVFPILGTDQVVKVNKEKTK